jgi:Methyltransferase domain
MTTVSRRYNRPTNYVGALILFTLLCLGIIALTRSNNHNWKDKWNFNRKSNVIQTTSSLFTGDTKNLRLVDIVLPAGNGKDYEDKDERCRITLDALDRNWDHRRQMRQSVALTYFKGRAPGENELFDLYEPEATCATEERFGHEPDRYMAFGDGPKFLCGVDLLLQESSSSSLTKSKCLIYSFALIPELIFETSIAKTLSHCEIHTFNPSLDMKSGGGGITLPPGVTVHPWALGSIDGATEGYMGRSYETYTLATLQAKLGHSGRPIDILKIDMERFEYVHMPSLFDAIADGRLVVHQLQVELHAFAITDTVEYFEKIRFLFDSADRAEMRIFHKERNGWNCGGQKCVEYAFASRHFLRKANAQIVCGEPAMKRGIRHRHLVGYPSFSAT